MRRQVEVGEIVGSEELQRHNVLKWELGYRMLSR